MPNRTPPRATAGNARRPLTPRERQALRAKQRRRQRRKMFLFSAAFILIVSAIITAIIELPGRASAQTDAAQSAADAAQQAETSQEGAVTQEALGTFGPVQLTSWTYTQPSVAVMSQPENGRVDMSYFDTALFIGDSLTQGFQVYSSGIQNAHYAAYVGAGPRQMMEGTVTNVNGEVVAAMDEILAANASKVYILLGTNTLSSLDDEALLKYYNDFLNFLQPQLDAGVTYYIQGIPPVTAEKSDTDANYSNERIRSLNESLAAMAYTRGWHYIDLYSALADEGGALRADLVAGSDGVHLNGTGYEAWKEYLITHTAYSAQSPYIAGSPYLI